MTTRPNKPVKPRRMLQNDMTGEVYRTCAPWQRKFASPVLVIDLSPESVEALIEKADQALWNMERQPISPNKPKLGTAEIALAAIGIKARKGRK